ncbi:hypothetical protein PV327_002859 [Microctonus hyperodae]|uniref:Gustatory receptor n=1 Tax=Microctonus hyperodae TaxID=165561 RepID=A0AA39FGI1_MICHY|nr:hypothetical protein PV327_002859 [Microctonus hyperodae]
MASTEDLINVTFEKSPKLLSVNEILKPSTIISWLLGAGVARPANCPKILTFFVRFINFVICSVIIAYGAIDFFFFGSVFKSDTFKIMYYSNKAVCYVSSYWYVIQGLVQYSKWPILMMEFETIDKKMNQFGWKNDNRTIKKFQILTIIATIVLGPLSLISHALYYYFTRPEDIFASDLLLYHTIAQSLAMNFTFDLVVLTIYNRFQTINNAAMRITEQLTAGLIIQEIRRFREIHHAICNIVRNVNSIHGGHLLLSSLNSFTMVVATLFRIYMGVVEGKHSFMMINNVIWMTYAAQFALTCFICTFAVRESAKTGIIIHEIILRRVPHKQRHCDLYSIDVSRSNNDPELFLRHEVNDFSSQLYHCNVGFTAFEFFLMDNELLRSFIGVITTYLIILVQFYEPENDSVIPMNATTIDTLQ